jgi:hypothetical protein
MSSPPIFSGVRVSRSLVLYVCFVNRCLFSFGHCAICSSSIYGFCLTLWYLQTLLGTDVDFFSSKSILLNDVQSFFLFFPILMHTCFPLIHEDCVFLLIILYWPVFVTPTPPLPPPPFGIHTATVHCSVHKNCVDGDLLTFIFSMYYFIYLDYDLVYWSL